ncbi:MAG TPA: hypothetical protein PKD54_00075 [Pirellulaceae bacterium]|nr:hypothetical protein [Pirellulaceae bacterium]
MAVPMVIALDFAMTTGYSLGCERYRRLVKYPGIRRQVPNQVA